MTDRVIIATTTERARRLGRLLDAADDSGIGTPATDPQIDNSAKVVRLLTAIAAGSTTPVTAEIMTLNGLTWAGTGQTIQVRSATGLAVTTTGRRIARRCSRWGWVVVET